MSSFINKKSNQYYLIFTIIIFFKIFSVFYVNKIPCMDNFSYYHLGDTLLSGQKVNIDKVTTPGYAIIYYLLALFLESKIIASNLIFIFSSFLIIFSITKIIMLKENKINDKAIQVLLMLGTIPFLSAQSVGYSHTIYFATSLFLLSIFFFLKENYKLNNKYFLKYKFFLLFSFLAFFIRNEFIIYTIFMLIGFLLIDIKNKLKLISLLLVSLIIFILIHKFFIYHISLDKEFVGAFNDYRYSYNVWTHTLSFRELGYFDPKYSTMRARELFGDEITLNYSIIKASIQNPLEVIKNFIYNLKMIFIYLPYPSFIPIYIYFFLGINLEKITNPKKSYCTPLFFSITSILLLQIIFHAEIRYLIPAGALLMIILLKNINLNSLLQKKTYIVILLLNTAISLMYLNQSSKVISFCN